MPPLYAILGFVIVQRLAELVFAHRNYRTLAVHGAIEVGRSHYPAMVALHAGWLLALLWTRARRGRPRSRTATASAARPVTRPPPGRGRAATCGWVRLFFVGGRISLGGSEAGGNWICHGVVREQRRGPVADGTCAVSDGWGCSAGTRALGGGSQYASMRRRPVAA